MPHEGEPTERGVRTPPRFCPGCGAEFRDTEKTRGVVAVGQPSGPLGIAEVEPAEPWGWDCYCATCEWSGDISPDEEFPPQKEPGP